MESLQGQLLVASSSLTDPNFVKTIVLIAVHGDDGAIGLILNRELGTPVRDIWSQVSKTRCVRRENVRHGGPVRGTLMAIHDHRSLANLVVAQGIYLATELSAMESLAIQDEGPILFYLGHARWEPGQLEGELREGAWHLLPVRVEHAFGDLDAESVWKQAVNEAGRRGLRALVPVKHVPDDPRAN
jgi:putative transcriptional regulator